MQARMRANRHNLQSSQSWTYLILSLQLGYDVSGYLPSGHHIQVKWQMERNMKATVTQSDSERARHVDLI